MADITEANPRRVNRSSQMAAFIADRWRGRRKIDGAALVEDFLQLAEGGDRLHCAFAPPSAWQIATDGESPSEVVMENARSRLRFVCATLAGLCGIKAGAERVVFGGEADLLRPSGTRWHARWANNNGQPIEFTLTRATD